MSNYFKAIDAFAVNLTSWVIRHRWLVLLLALFLAIGAGYGAKNLVIEENYRVFFSDENPELQAFEELEATYTKNDNFLFVIEPKTGSAFTAETLDVVEKLTEQAWLIPYSLRVDSVTNFQHTYAIEDDLIVENLIEDALSRPDDYISERKSVALDEPLLSNQLLTPNGRVTAVNVILQYPEKSLTEIPEAVAVARDIVNKIETEHPNIEIYLSGVSMMDGAFAEASMQDASTLTPLMFIIIFLLAWIIVRSLSATFVTLIVVVLSSVVGMGMGGYLGFPLTPISMSAPTIILTLAVADSIHILLSLKGLMRNGQDKTSALIEAVRANFLPVAITSITTIVGFLALNFSDSPPYWHLGNITAIGIAAAWFYSITLLPALLSILPYRVAQADNVEWSTRVMDRLAVLVIENSRKFLAGMGLTTLALIVLIPTLELNDQWVDYFDERIEFRRDSDQIQDYFGLYPIEYSVPATGPGGVSDPQYLKHIEEFTEFLRSQQIVTHVYSLSDIMKRLNKNMHGDDPVYYRLPDDRDLAAQYLLLYELSLPYGLDLNDRINIDKSATRVTATISRASTTEIKALFANAAAWQKENWPSHMYNDPTSATVMFAYISERNVENMIFGTILAVVAISLIMMFALQSLHLGTLSLISNGLPILATFGAWALLVGTVGFSVATVASISLGIIVDDSVHFLSKYVRARDEQSLSIEDSIRYAFKNVGVAIVVNTIVLTAGFFVMTTSAFKLNVDLGLMTILAIVFALIIDFLFLPALLLLGKRKEQQASEPPSTETSGSTSTT